MYIVNILKGVIIGIAKIIPGLSGAVLMISFHLYDKAIHAITCFFDDAWNHFKFLLSLCLGIVLGIVLFSKVMVYFLNHYYLYTTSLFLGLILGGMGIVYREANKERSGIVIFLISFFLMMILTLSNLDYTYQLQNNYMDYLVFFLAGILEAIGTVLPGISSTALLMLVGVYPYYLLTLSRMLDFGYLMSTLGFVLPFGLGMFLGIIGLVLLVHFLFMKYRKETFSFVLGVTLSSVVLLMIRLFPYILGLGSIFISLLLFLVGYLITYKL